MFNVNVNYKNYNTPEENDAVRQMYTQTRDYGEVCSYFADFGLCDDAMLDWAIVCQHRTRFRRISPFTAKKRRRISCVSKMSIGSAQIRI